MFDGIILAHVAVPGDTTVGWDARLYLKLQ